MISWDKDLTDRSTSSSSSPKNGIGFSEQYKRGLNSDSVSFFSL
ncbi:unnamed protein product [Brassica oleracea]